MIRLAISKGRILEEGLKVLEKMGIVCSINPLNSRKLIIPTSDKNIEITSGLTKGDIIVAEGLKKVRPRGKIKPINK